MEGQPESTEPCWPPTDTIPWSASPRKGRSFFRSADYDPSRKYPLLVVIHGGPTGVDRAVLAADRYYPMERFAAKGALILPIGRLRPFSKISTTRRDPWRANRSRPSRAGRRPILSHGALRRERGAHSSDRPTTTLLENIHYSS